MCVCKYAVYTLALWHRSMAFAKLLEELAGRRLTDQSITHVLHMLVRFPRLFLLLRSNSSVSTFLIILDVFPLRKTFMMCVNGVFCMMQSRHPRLSHQTEASIIHVLRKSHISPCCRAFESSLRRLFVRRCL